MESSRPVRAITHTILAWNTRTEELLNVNNMADLATKLSNIPLTLLRDFLSPEEEDTLFLNDLEEELAFSSVTSIFFSAQICENCGLLRTQGFSLLFGWLQEPFLDDIHDI